MPTCCIQVPLQKIVCMYVSYRKHTYNNFSRVVFLSFSILDESLRRSPSLHHTISMNRPCGRPRSVTSTASFAAAVRQAERAWKIICPRLSNLDRGE
jgi:hypothetical protein